MGDIVNTLFGTGEYLAANLFGTVRIALTGFSIILFLAFIYVLWRLWNVPPWPKPHESAQDALHTKHTPNSRIQKQWLKIRERLEQPAEAEWKVAVIEADMLVDDVLRRLEYPGETMGERLKGISKDQIQTIEAIWEAHKIRNRIVHDPDIRIMHRDARVAIQNMEAFLKEVNLIEE